MSDEIRFDGRVAIVTGAGGGLGKEHAKLLASRGAAVIVNDLGGGLTGDGASAGPAQQVVDEIKAAGGEAVANTNSVEDGEAIVQTALDNYKRIDIVVNNAGILRDKSFAKMTDEDWDLVYRVHVKGAYKVTHAAWPHMRELEFGRIVNTSSSTGIYGNFGQMNYGMAKLGLHGFTNTLAIEGYSKNIHANSIAPVAKSRMTEELMAPEVLAKILPEYVSPLVAWLCHDDCQENGSLFEVGAGWFGKLRWQRSAGVGLATKDINIESVKANWDAITDFSNPEYPATSAESIAGISRNFASLQD